MGFYGGRTGQHFYIAGVYDSLAQVPADIMSNQFILAKDNGEYSLFVKSGSNLIDIGKVGAFYPTVDNEGNWTVGGKSLEEKAQPLQMVLKIPYDAETKTYITEPVEDGDGSIRQACFIKYAYTYINPQTTDIEDIDIPESEWHNLVEVTGLHTLNTYVQEFSEKSVIMEEQSINTANNANLTRILTELNKSYFTGNGTTFEDIVEYPEDYEEDIKTRLEDNEYQKEHNIEKYYSDIQATENRVSEIRNAVEELRSQIYEHLEYNSKVDDDAWRAMVTAELSAAARASMDSKEHPLLTERLDRMLYQFDTFADMRVFSLLQPGDSCITFGANRIGDSHSLLFRVYENDAAMKESGDLKEDGGKYYISLPGGVKQPTEKQLLKNGYVAYAIAMFSGLGGGGGSGGTSSGSISTTYTGSAVQPGTVVKIPIEWYGKVSGDGIIHVYERSASSTGGTPYATLTDFPEGHGVVEWKASYEGKRVIVIYATDRDGNKTNQLKIEMVVGGLKAKLDINDNVKYDLGETVRIPIVITSILDGKAEIACALNGKAQTTKTVNLVANTDLKTELAFNNLSVGGYSAEIIISQEEMPEVKLNIAFTVIAAGQVTIVAQHDSSADYPLNSVITIPYESYYYADKRFNNKLYIGGGDLNFTEDDERITISGITYKLIRSAMSSINTPAEFQISPEDLGLTQDQTYYLMITSQAQNFSNITGQLTEPLVLKVIEAEDTLGIADKWGALDLLYYFDARKGQTNNDETKDVWQDIAPRYYTQKEPGVPFEPKPRYGTDFTCQLTDDSFNWSTNGWNVPGHKGLYLNGTANGSFTGAKGINYIFAQTQGQQPIFGDKDETTTLGEGVGRTFIFYLKPEDQGTNARLIEIPYGSDGEVGISINTRQVKVGVSTADYLGLTVEIEPNKENHIAIVYDPIGATRYYDKEKEEEVFGGLIKIYVNGICRAASMITSDFFDNPTALPQGFSVNNSASDAMIANSTKPKYVQGAFEFYAFKVFKRSLTHEEVLYNYIYDIDDSELQVNLINANKLGQANIITNPEIILYPPNGTLDGITKDVSKEMEVEYITNSQVGFSKKYANCKVQWQGTSSIAYPVKNYKIKFPEKFTLDKDGRHVTTNGMGKLEKTYTLKADYMDSSHCHNTGNANFVNDTGLLSNYSLTPAQVKDIYDLNKDRLGRINGDPYREFLTNIEAGIYYKVEGATARPYTLADFPEDMALEIRNSIYGIPCKLYAYVKTGEQNENNEDIWDNVFLGIYNFNNDKGNLDTFGLYRDKNDKAFFPGCTSFEISANSYSTAGAFKERQLVAHVEWNEEKTAYTVLDYYTTNLSTTYNLKEGSSTEYIPSVFGEGSFCQCCKCTIEGSNISIANTKAANYLLKNNLILVTPQEAWSDNLELIENYNNLKVNYYMADFELRAPDNDGYYLDEDKNIPSLEYYSEYDKLDKLASWVNDADEATFKREFTDHFDLDTTLNYYLFVMTTGLIDNFGKNLMLNTWGCDKNGKIPYITKTVNNKTYYKVRRFSRVLDGKDIGHYEYGYSLCDTLSSADNEIFIYNFDKDENILLNEEPLYSLDKDYKKWNCTTDYDDTDKDGVIIGEWHKMLDENRFIWYPHPYDLDSCLGLDNMGRIRYSTDIEMLPKDANDGFNDYFDHVYNQQASAFNTSTSNLWKKFYDYFEDEIIDRYAELRQTKILHIDTFKEYYYNKQISQMNAMAYNDDMQSKYLSGDVANVVISGSPAQVYPTEYAFMCHGDDWNRIYRWINNRLNFLDSLYQYGLMADVITARATAGNAYNLSIELHNPQYVAISWANREDNPTENPERIWTDENGNQYGLVYNAFSLNKEAIEYGFVAVNKTATGYSYNKDVYIYNETTKNYVSAEGGNYYKVFAVNTNSSTDEKKWTPNFNKFDYGYITYWIPGVVNTLQSSFQLKKIGEKFEPATGNYNRIKLVTSADTFSYSSDVADQEVNIYGASNIKYLAGLESLKPKSLSLTGARKLVKLECHGGGYSDINVAHMSLLKEIDLSNSMSLTITNGLDISNLMNLEKLNLGLTNVARVIFPRNGGILSSLTLGPAITNLALNNQTSLESVTLQAMLKNNSVDVLAAIEDFNMFESIELENCPNVQFNFEAVRTTTVGETTTYSTKPFYYKEGDKLTALGQYVQDYGLFSMFKHLQKLHIQNSCIYNEDTNPFGIGKNNEFILSVGATYSTNGSTNGYDRNNIQQLRSVYVGGIPIKKFSINATKNNVSFPGLGLSTEGYTNTILNLSDSLEEIRIFNTGTTTRYVYLPCLTDLRKYTNLKKIEFDDVYIGAKEQRIKAGVDCNALGIILPDTDTLKEINFNLKSYNITNIITSIGTDFDNRFIFSSDGTTLLSEKEGYKNIIDLASANNLNRLKMNFTGFTKIETIKGLNKILLDIGNVTTPAVGSLYGYFANCQKLYRLQDSEDKTFDFMSSGKRWNQFANNPSLDYMFYNCSRLTNDNIKDFIGEEARPYGSEITDNACQLQSAIFMFAGCPGLTKLKPSFEKVPNLQSLKQFAYNSNGIEEFELTIKNSKDLNSLEGLIAQADSSTDNKLKSFKLNVQYLSDTTPNSGLQTVTTMANMLINNTKLEALDMSDWNMSSLQNATAMCKDNTNLTNLLVSDYHFPLLQTAQEMFSGCNNLQSFNAIWTFASQPSETGVSLQSLFQNCEKLNLSFLQSWDMANVTNINSFCSKAGITATYQENEINSEGNFELDISNWKVKNITNAGLAFAQTNFVKLITNNLDEDHTFQSLTNAYRFLYLNKQITEFTSALIPKHTSAQLNNMAGMFEECTSLRNLGEGYKNWNVALVTSFEKTFYKTKIPSLVLSSWDFSSATNYKSFFEGNTALTSITGIENLFATNKARSIDGIFAGCSELKESTLENVSKWKAFISSDAQNDANECVISSFARAFEGLSKLTNSNKIFTNDWLNKKYTNVTNITKIFNGCSNCSEIKLPPFKNIDTAQHAFANCTNLKLLDLHLANFYNCKEGTYVQGIDAQNDKLYEWIGGSNSIGKIIFPKADGANKIGFINCTIDLRPLKLNSVVEDGAANLGQYLSGYAEKYEILPGYGGIETPPDGGTFAISQAILNSQISASNQQPDIKFSANSGYSDYFNVARTYKWSEADTYTSEALYIAGVKQWMIGV